MKKYLLLFFSVIYLLSMNTINGQSLGLNNSSPDASSILDITANNKGVLVPRMTTANRNAITTPAKGLLVFDTDKNLFYYNSGTSGSPIWVPISTGWNTSTTRIKITAADFMATCKSNKGAPQPKGVGYDNISGTNLNYGIVMGDDASDLMTSFAIPTGYKATHVKIYGNDTGRTFDVYEGDITTGSLSASKGSANIGSESNITDVSSTDTNCLVIIIHFDNKESDKAYGGYITIEPF